MMTDSRPNLAVAFSKLHAREEAESTWDDETLHVSDFTQCPRAVWARRNGLQDLPFSPESLEQMAMGRIYEDRFAAALNAGGEDYVRQARFNAEIDGHIDFLGYDRVIELKTTTFYAKWVDGKKVYQAPTECKEDYAVQAASYAFTVAVPFATVVVVCRASGMRAEFDIDVEAYRSLASDRCDERRALTPPGAPEPVDALPPAHTWKNGVSWHCGSCRYSACERNTNPQKDAI